MRSPTHRSLTARHHRHESVGENTIVIDCDVLQADGGTRTASITGAYVALVDALGMRGRGLIGKDASPLVDSVAAVSVGVVGGVPVADLDYPEDSTADTDMNVVATGSGSSSRSRGPLRAPAQPSTAVSWTVCWGSRRTPAPNCPCSSRRP